jgi:ABC-type polysaccharide/polyol phosphate transport system ATPase subunit
VSTCAIEVNGITKSFALPHEIRSTLKEHFLHPLRRVSIEHQHALSDISFDVMQGEFFGIIGPNGSGKSTLLKILAGIYRQDAGTVVVNGMLSPFIELGVGFNPDLNARDNILINGTLLGLTRSQLEERLESILEFAELERFADQKLKNYSSGMQLRLAFSIAIQVPFDILMLDEVLAVGDASFQKKCFGVFDELRETNKTIVFVSHDLATMKRYCNRVAYIESGRLERIGAPDEVVDYYVPNNETVLT